MSMAAPSAVMTVSAEVSGTSKTAQNGTQSGTSTAAQNGTQSSTSTATQNGTQSSTSTATQNGTQSSASTAAQNGTQSSTSTATQNGTQSGTSTTAQNGTQSSTSTTAQTSTTSTTQATTTQSVEPTFNSYGILVTGLSPADAKVLVIDPGHCNIHPGARGNGLKEEVVNMDISNAFCEALTDYGEITVYMTREDGGCCRSLVSGSDCLYARSNYACDLEADFLVSIHINAGYSNGANALVAYDSGYHSEICRQTQGFGRVALKKLKAIGIANKGFLLRKSGSGSRYPNGKVCDYYAIVRRGVVDRIPGVIIEHGYITSASDCKKFFKTRAKREKVGKADAEAVIDYYHLSKKVVDGEFVEENGATFYKTAEGNKVGGWVKFDNTWFYFSEKNGQLQKGMLNIDGNSFYLNPSTGEMVVGEFELNGYDYLARGNGTLVKAAKHTDGIRTHLYDGNGRKLKKGFHTIDGSIYYVTSNTNVASGVCKIGSEYYGFDPDTGKMLYGAQTIRNKEYYFDQKTGVAARNKMVVIDGETYFYGKKAYEQYGWVKYKGAKYYFAKGSGEMVTGWKKIKGKYYYFDEETGKMAKSKWIDDYYVNKKGVRTKKR